MVTGFVFFGFLDCWVCFFHYFSVVFFADLEDLGVGDWFFDHEGSSEACD